jgi:hypothetical protein
MNDLDLNKPDLDEMDLDEMHLNEMHLNNALRSLCTRYPPMPRAPEIETRLLAAFDAREHARPQRLWMPAAVLAMAASLAAVGFLHDLRGRPATQPATETRNEKVFVAIPYTFPPAPYERTTVVRMNVEIAALMAAGFKVQMADAGASVPADVLFGQDGRAVAIRTLTVPIL